MYFTKWGIVLRFHASKIIKITSIILKYLIPIFHCREWQIHLNIA